MVSKQYFAIKSMKAILIEPTLNSDSLTESERIVLLGMIHDCGFSFNESDTRKFISSQITYDKAAEIIQAIEYVVGDHVAHKFLQGSFPIKDPNQLHRSITACMNYLHQYFPDVFHSVLQEDRIAAPLQITHYSDPKILTIVDSVDDKLLELFGSKIPLSADNAELVTYLYNTNDQVLSRVDTSLIVLKEVLAYQIKREIESNDIDKITSARSATDILRAIALISGEPNGKLDSPFSIKSIPNKQRRKIVECLDKVATIDDLTINKNLFKRLFKMLHLNTPRFKNFDNINNLAKTLREVNNPKTIRTEIQRIVDGFGSEEGFEYLINNPSVFVRNLDAILRKYDSSEVVNKVIKSFTTNTVNTKILLQALEHFNNRLVKLDTRMFTLKGRSQPVVVDDKPLEPMEFKTVEMLSDIFTEELKRQYKQGSNWFERAYIDPSLYGINIPKNLSEEDGLKLLSRGSRYKLNTGDKGSVIRLFVHWADTCDIDLSAVLYDQEFKIIDDRDARINFGNLHGPFYEHSGDVRYAPDGGSEFIDIELDKIPTSTRYIVMVVNNYSGDCYDGVNELFAGFMIRKDRLLGKAFEPRTVEDKFSIRGGSNIKQLFAYDVSTDEIIMINASSTTRDAYSVSEMDNENQLLKSIIERKCVSVGKLIELHSDYVLCEDEQLTLSDEEKSKTTFFNTDYGLDVLNITTNMM